jgi:hypothetical protein
VAKTGALPKTNLDLERLDAIAGMAKEIREWLGDWDHPERYPQADPQLVRDFVHTLDLLETTLTRFEITASLARLALLNIAEWHDTESLGWEFWQIDIEEFIAASVLEFSYQLDNAWQSLAGFAKKDNAFKIIDGNYRKPSKTLLARHHATHFHPDHFQQHRIADEYSILRRPYVVEEGVLKKELARVTLPKVAALIRAAIDEGFRYITLFRDAIKESPTATDF